MLKTFLQLSLSSKVRTITILDFGSKRNYLGSTLDSNLTNSPFMNDKSLTNRFETRIQVTKNRREAQLELYYQEQ